MTANLFTTKKTIERTGLFDERLYSGGDVDWGLRHHSLGLALEYAEDVRVSHFARSTVGELCRRSARVAGGLQQMAEHEGRATEGVRRAIGQLLLLRNIRSAISAETLDTINKKLRFAGVAWLVEATRTLERYRVHYGGKPRRV